MLDGDEIYGAIGILEDNNNFLKAQSTGNDEFYRRYSEGFDAIEDLSKTMHEIYHKGYEAGKKAATEEVLTNIVPLYNCNDIVSNDTCHAYKDCMQCCVDRYRKQMEEKANDRK